MTMMEQVKREVHYHLVTKIVKTTATFS